MKAFCMIVLAMTVVISQARFNQENPAVLVDIRNCAPGFPGQITGQMATFSGTAINTLLPAADACAQQDMSDAMLDYARANFLPVACYNAARTFRKAERNVDPFANPNPCGPYCNRLPRNKELLTLLQATDPACNLPAYFAANPDQKKWYDQALRAGGPSPPVVPPARGPNLMTFPGVLGQPAPAVWRVGSQWLVQGNSPMNTLKDALTRSCDVQKNLCGDAANRSGNKAPLTVQACDVQYQACLVHVK